MARKPTTQIWGRLIKKLRQQRRLSQETLAEKAGIHPTYVGMLERGLRLPGIDVAERIAFALDKKLSDLAAEAERTTADRD
ncbi:MAG: helix-turn-helix domain-containing protein [Verrucomicrobiales bacterium]|nr:helix-turn-helix domain-containing protein [Verrucomicrobiales bacterium]